jgi:hypothetical protein
VTPYEKQRTEALAAFSRPFADRARVEFRELKAAQLAAVHSERRSLRQAMDSMRRSYEALRAGYIRVTGTTIAVWDLYGPNREWDECIHAAREPSVWDRLVERGLAPDELAK